MFNFESEESSMHLESEHFIVDKDKSDYFEELWEHYQGKKYFLCIYRRDGQFCGVIQLDKNSDMECASV